MHHLRQCASGSLTHTLGSAVPLVTSSLSKSDRPSASTSRSTPGELGCHTGGEFLSRLSSHLVSPPGRNGAVKQIVANVGKHLHFLNPESVEVEQLLTHSAVHQACGRSRHWSSAEAAYLTQWP